jgi:hypothetical protein
MVNLLKGITLGDLIGVETRIAYACDDVGALAPVDSSRETDPTVPNQLVGQMLIAVDFDTV